MSETAAKLVDHILPHSPVRQWVLSLPFALRYLLAFDAKLCSAVLNIFLQRVFHWQRWIAKKVLGLDSVQQAQSGSVTWIQRFGGAINLNIHFHALVLDGVYVRDTSGVAPVFRALPAPSNADLMATTEEVVERVRRLLERDGYTDEGGVDRLAEDEPTLAACASASVRGLVASGTRAGQPVQRIRTIPALPASEDRALGPYCVQVQGFNLHANVRVGARDRARLERLCRYIARPPFSHGRLELLSDGRVSYRLKSAWADGTTAVAFAPGEFLEKLAVLVPPPRVHQVRYHGILAPHARDRHAVVPRAAPGMATEDAEVAGCHRSPKRLSWAELMKRVWAIDVLLCPRCAGRLAVIACITEPSVAQRILAACRLAQAPPRMYPPRQSLDVSIWDSP